MRRDGRRSRVRLGLGLAVAAVAAGVIAPPADAWPRWPGGVITYHVESPGLRWSTQQAAAAWNRSGAHVRFVERRAGQASLTVRAMRGGVCNGVVGQAPLGALPRGYRGIVWLQPRCGRYLLVEVAAHELGHTLGLEHDTRHCSIMAPSTGGGCKDVPYPGEYRCRPLQRVDVRRAVALYGGRVPPRVDTTICVAPGTPAAPRAVRVEANPAGSLAATRVSWRNPDSRSLRRIVIARGKGTACPNYPPMLGRVALPAGLIPRMGELVADIPATGKSGAVQDYYEAESAGRGRWCYTVWAIGPQGRYARAAVVQVDLVPLDRSATRIGLAATLTPAAGVRVRLGWTNPAAPVYAKVRVQRQTGACPADPQRFSGQDVAQVASTPGPAVVDDTDATSAGGTWCYGLRFEEGGNAFGAPVVLLQVDGVPEPPNVPPVATIRAYATEGSITDGTNEIFLSDDSTDADGRVVAWQWSLGDGTTSADASLSHVYTAPGTYPVTLVVTDDRGATASATQTITILP